MNKAILMGRLTKDPELRYTSNTNTPVCSFTLAVDRRFAKQGEERQADFLPVVSYGKLAEFCSKYFSKGRAMLVVGRIQTRTWDDAEGKRHYVTEIIADEAYFADSKRSDDTGAPKVVQNYSAGDIAEPSEGIFPIEDDQDDLPF